MSLTSVNKTSYLMSFICSLAILNSKSVEIGKGILPDFSIPKIVGITSISFFI